MQFAQIPGLEEVKKTLIESVKSNHIAHAQLFVGKEGNAQLAMALAYATYINCTSKSEDGSCTEDDSVFRKYAKLIHPDLHFVFPTTTTKKITKGAISQAFMNEWRPFLLNSPYVGLPDWAAHIGAENKQCNISKEESRNIIKGLSLKAFEAEYKVMVIWLPELMHPSAANAILKVLEEPPEKTLFFLVSNNADALLTTILSRTQIIQIPQFSDQEITTYLQEKVGLEAEKADQVAYLADGNMREALRLSTEVQDDNENYFKQWMRLCYTNDYSELLKWADSFNRMGKEAQKSLFQFGLGMFREAMIWKFSGADLARLDGQKLDFVKNFSNVINEKNLEFFISYFNDAFYHLERNANARILFFNLSLRIAKIIRVK